MRRRSLGALLLLALGLAAGCTSLPSSSPFKGAELSSTPLLGKFVWRDLVTENPDAVKPFYAALFGWEFEEGRALGAPYTLVKSGGQYIAGISKTRRPQPDQPVSQWLSFMSVADVDRAAEQTRAAGGSVVAGPLDLPNIGRGAVVLDPDGAPLGLLRSSLGDPADSADAGAEPLPVDRTPVARPAGQRRVLCRAGRLRGAQDRLRRQALLGAGERAASGPACCATRSRSTGPIWLAYRPGGRPGRHPRRVPRNWAGACCWPRAATCATARWR